MSRTLAAALVSFAGLACGGQALSTSPSESTVDAGVTSVTGSINGISLPNAYALAIPDNSAATGPLTNQYTQLALGIANKPIGCSTPGIPNGAFLGIQLITAGATPIGPGTYEINSDPSSNIDNIAALVTTDSSCEEASPATCVGGSVTITSASATMFAGSFILAFDSGQTMTGTFVADVCTSVPASLNGTTC
jgi:hypothetical protein